MCIRDRFLTLRQCYKPGVAQSCFEASVAEKPLNIEYVLGFYVFGCSFPASQCVKMYLQQPRVSKLVGNPFSFSSELSSEIFGAFNLPYSR